MIGSSTKISKLFVFYQRKCVIWKGTEIPFKGIFTDVDPHFLSHVLVDLSKKKKTFPKFQSI